MDSPDSRSLQHTPTWTPKLRSTRRSKFYSSPRFLELMAKTKQRKGSPYPRKGGGVVPGRRHTQDTVDPRRIKLTRLLGSGGFGAVYQGVVGGKAVAVKKLHAHAGKNAKARIQSFQAETRVLHLCHPNIVSVLGTYCETEYDNSYIIMEYVSDVNLQRVINEATEPLSIERRLRCAHDVANALAYIHSHNVVHLDVKPANIIITPSNVCKLADFGCCQFLNDTSNKHLQSPTQRCYLTGTVAYRAPEVLRGDAPSCKADIYSFGITLWQMTTREIPFAGENQHVIIFGVVAQNLRPSLPQTTGEEVYEEGKTVEDKEDVGTAEALLETLMKNCWDGEVRRRPSAQDACGVVHDMMLAMQMHTRAGEIDTPVQRAREWRRGSAATPVTSLFCLGDGLSPRHN